MMIAIAFLMFFSLVAAWLVAPASSGPKAAANPAPASPTFALSLSEPAA